MKSATDFHWELRTEGWSEQVELRIFLLQSKRRREIRESKDSVLERQRRLVSPALQCLDKL